MTIETDKFGTSKQVRQGLRAVAVNRSKENKKRLSGLTVESKQQPEEGAFTTDILKGNKLLRPRLILLSS